MKIVLFGAAQRIGALEDGKIVDLNYAFVKYVSEKTDERRPSALAGLVVPPDLGGFIEAGPRGLDGARRSIEYLFGQALDQEGPNGEVIVCQAGQVKLHPPLASRAARIICAGTNYPDHTQGLRRHATGKLIPIDEIVQDARETGVHGFWKFSRSTVGPNDEIIYPSRTQRLDYEGEVAAVLGRTGKDISAGRAGEYIWGYSLHHDWSIRGESGSSGSTSGFSLAKNFDTCSTLGPCIVVDEIGDPQNIPFETRVNGELRQRGNTRDMIFSFAEVLEYISKDLSIWPGDIISGGTCAGTVMDTRGAKADPGLFLKPGDGVELSSPLIGSMQNRVVAKSPAA